MSSEGQRIVHELDTSDEDAFPGRHRAPAPVGRRVRVRLGLAAFGVLLATGLGAVTADMLGLTEVGDLTSQDGVPRVIPPDQEQEPRAGRTIDLHSRPALPSPPPDAPPPGEPSERAPAAAASAPARQAAPASVASASAPIRTVRTGDSCPTVGQPGMTTRGDAAVCTASRGKGPNKWRTG